MYLWTALRTIKNSSHMMHVRHKSRSVPSPNFMVQGWDSFVANDRYAGGLARKGCDLRSVGRGLRALPIFIEFDGRLLTLVVEPLRRRCSSASWCLVEFEEAFAFDSVGLLENERDFAHSSKGSCCDALSGAGDSFIPLSTGQPKRVEETHFLADTIRRWPWQNVQARVC